MSEKTGAMIAVVVMLMLLGVGVGLKYEHDLAEHRDYSADGWNELAEILLRKGIVSGHSGMDGNGRLVLIWKACDSCDCLKESAQ